MHFQIIPSGFPNWVYIFPNKTLPVYLDVLENPIASKYFQVFLSNFKMKMNKDLKVLHRGTDTSLNFVPRQNECKIHHLTCHDHVNTVHSSTSKCKHNSIQITDSEFYRKISLTMITSRTEMYYLT